MTPIYLPENCTPAYQLNWSVALFGRSTFPAPDAWLGALKTATESDGVRILEHRHSAANVTQFFVSTRPNLAPSDIVRSLKGRWQYILRSEYPTLFRRNYSIISVGDANSETLDRYVGGQVARHPMVDARVTQRLAGFQFHDPSVAIDQVRIGNYGRFVYGLQIVIENQGGWSEIREDVLAGSRAMILQASKSKNWQLARIGLVCNHIHILLGCHVTESPQDVALSLLNNLAFAQGMRPAFRFGYYAGTFGKYNRSAIRRSLKDDWEPD